MGIQALSEPGAANFRPTLILDSDHPEVLKSAHAMSMGGVVNKTLLQRLHAELVKTLRPR